MNPSHRRRTHCLLLTLFASLLALGCGDDGDGGLPGEPVNCEWFTGENCWRRAANEFAACASNSQGTFDGDKTECTTADGGRVAFASPVPSDILVEDPWDFEVESNGTRCGRYQSDDHSIELTTASGTVRVTVHGTSGEVVTCPDGSEYSISLSSLFECPFELPGISWVQGDSLRVNLVGADDSVIFDCAR